MKENLMEKELSPAYLQSGVSVDINAPFRGVKFIANKQLDGADAQKLEETIPAEECLQFVIVGDLSIQSRYAHAFLAVTDKALYGFDDAFEGGVRRQAYEQIKRAYV